MKYILFFLVCFFINTVTANNFDNYQNHISANRLIVFFQENISEQEKEATFRLAGIGKNYTNLPAPKLSICFTDNFPLAKKYLESLPQVKAVSFFLTDGKENYAGVLNTFFVKLKDKNFEPLLKNKLVQMQQSEAVRDKYIPNLYKIENHQAKTKNTIDVCAELQHEGWVEYAKPDYLLNPIVSSNDQYFTREWNIHNTGSAIQGNGTPGADMKVDSAWTLTTGDPDIKVAIIDSGVDTLHADLVQNILPGHDAVSDSTDGYPTPAFPEDGHGTCCAGIIAAVQNNSIGVSGVAPTCKIIPVRSFYYINLQGNILPYSTASIFADAIGWSWDTAHSDILSNSWGLPPSLISVLPGGTQPVDDAIQQAYINGRNGKGIPMFFSSGNDNDSTSPIWPSKLPQTIAVNATSMCDERKSPTDCSGENWGGDYGTGLDFSAPGVKISTTDITGSKGFSPSNYYLLFNGTSAACPNAAAVGALLLSLRPDFSAEDVRNVIAQSCDKVGGYAYDSITTNGSWSHELGYGRINAFKALQLSLYYSSVKLVENDYELKLFPNPAQQVLYIEYRGLNESVLGLFDITGKKLMGKKITERLEQIDISILPAGIYFIKFDTDKTSVVRKFTVCR